MPVALVQQIRHGGETGETDLIKPVIGGDSLEHPFVLKGKMSESQLRKEEAYGFWVSHGYSVPGIATKYLFYAGAGRKIDAVYYRVFGDTKEVCFYFEVTNVELTKDALNQKPEPMPDSAPHR